MRAIGMAAAGALLAALGAMPAGAQTAQRQAPPPIVPVPPVVTSPPIQTLPADPYGTVRATALVRSDGELRAVDFLDDGAVARLRFRDATGGVYAWFEFYEPGDFVRILADTRFAPLWPAILEWAGGDLSQGARKMLARVEAAAAARTPASDARTPAESSVGEVTQALFQRDAMLRAVGRRDEANAALRAALVPRKRSGIDRIDRMFIALRLGNSLASENRAAGIAALRNGERLAGNSPFAINFRINRAAYLAEAGRYPEALALIEAAEAEFARQTDSGNTGKIAGSNRQFTWIHACALHGLGRDAEAAPLIAALAVAPEAWDRDFVTPANFDIRLRAAFCLGDREMAVREILAAIGGDALGSPVWLWLQPALRPFNRDPGFLASVREDARVQAAIAGRMRVLPPALEPALNAWRGRPLVR